MKNVLFIYNKTSGKGKIIKYVDYIKEKLQMAFDIVDIYEPDSKEDFINKLKESYRDYHTIVFAGGDGTFNLVANVFGNIEKENIPILGYIPLGTCNDIAKNNNIPYNIKKAVETIINGKTKEIDISSINDMFFVYAAAIGTGSACTYVTPQNIKKKLGRFGYLSYIIRELFKKRIVHAKFIDDKNEIEGDYSLIYVLNTREVGSFVFNPKAKVNNGTLEIVMIKKGKFSGRFNIVRFMFGRLFSIKRLPIDNFISSNFKIEVDNGTWNLDGEKGIDGSAQIKVKHNHFTLYTNKFVS